MKDKIYKSWVFLLSRSIVYIFSFFSYNDNLLNIKKWIEIFNKKELSIYLKLYKNKIVIFVLLLMLLVSGIKLIKNKIKSARKDQINIIKIRFNSIDRQLSYIGTFVLPLIASFQKIDILWLIFYEAFIFFIISKNIEDYYKMIYAFGFKEYVITLDSGDEIIIFSNILSNISIDELPKKINISCINISNENLSEYIYLYTK